MSDSIEVTPELVQRVGEKFQAWAGTLEADEQHALGLMMVTAAQMAQAYAAESNDTSGYAVGLSLLGPGAFGVFSPLSSSLTTSSGPSFAVVVGQAALPPGGAYGTYHYMRR